MPKVTSDFNKDIDYKEAQSKTTACYFGSLDFDPVKAYRADIKKNGSASPFYGCVLCPEARKGPFQVAEPNSGFWTYEKNQAFWAGLIDASRPLVLASNISYYKKIPKGTVDEILWLKDNDYRFIPDPATLSQTWVIPPDIPKTKREIKTYQNGAAEESGGARAILGRLGNIRTNIEKQREDYSSNFRLLFYNSIALLNTGTKSRDNKALESALSGFKRVYAHQPANDVFVYHVGRANFSLNRLVEATKAYLEAFNLLKSNPSAPVDGFLAVAAGLFQTNKYKEASECLARACQMTPTDSKVKEAYLNAFNFLKSKTTTPGKEFSSIAEHLCTEGHHEDALEWLKEAHKVKPEDTQTLRNMGLILTTLSKPEEAIPYYSQALAIELNNPAIFVERGEAYEKQGCLKEALEDYKKAYSLSNKAEIKKSIDELEQKIGNIEKQHAIKE